MFPARQLQRNVKFHRHISRAKAGAEWCCYSLGPSKDERLSQGTEGSIITISYLVSSRSIDQGAGTLLTATSHSGGGL